jgi:RNA-directed DNA polymerase
MPRKSNVMTFKKNNLCYSTSATEQDSSTIEKKLPNNAISYKDIINIETLTKGLEKTKSNVAPGIDGETKSNFTEKKLQTLHKSLKSQRYSPSPVKKVNVPKPNGGIRTLGIASQTDKIVQAAILQQLEPKLEKIFLKNSYGGRPGLNCHHALKEIKKKWQNITWIISIDIQKYFDNVNHDILLKILKNYCDQATIELINKLIKCGYVDLYNNPNHMEPTIVGIPQGSIISPILSNLYLHQLDQYIVESLLLLWNRGDSRKFISGYHTRKKLTAEERAVVEKLNLKGLTEAIARLKHNE